MDFLEEGRVRPYAEEELLLHEAILPTIASQYVYTDNEEEEDQPHEYRSRHPSLTMKVICTQGRECWRALNGCDTIVKLLLLLRKSTCVNTVNLP